MRRVDLSVGAGGEVLRLRLLRRAALPAVVDALMVVERVERSEHLVAQGAARRVQRLQVLLLGVPLERQPRGQQLAAHLAAVARAQRAHGAHCATHNNQHQRISQHASEPAAPYPHHATARSRTPDRVPSDGTNWHN